MPTDLILQQSASTTALQATRARLIQTRATLAEREATLNQLRTGLKLFEQTYLRQAGILYAELDDLEAQIAEREVDLYDSEAARRRALEARQRATETHEAAFSADLPPEEFDPPPNLKTLFRELARRIHPDLATDPVEQQHLTLLMMRANQAYTRGDTETLQRLLDDHREITAEEGPDGEFLRLERQIHHAQRDLATLDHEEESILNSEIGQLFTESQAATEQGRDLLAELSAGLGDQIVQAQYRLAFLNKQLENER